jgi:hypothetical protein
LNNSDLFSGIAIVIDDEIGDKKANINKLISQIEKRNMPYIKYAELPSPDITKHFDGISFLLLDWQLPSKTLSDSIVEGVKTPASVSDSAIEENIVFLKKIRESCFTPIFIFTNEEVETVKNKLIENGLCQVNKPNYIFVKSKKDLIGPKKLFNTINKWITKTPSVYVLKAWEKEYKKSKNKLFYDFYEMSPNWPIVLWESFADDGANMSLELGEVITRNLCSRMAPFAFDNKILDKPGKRAPKDEVRKVLEGERFIKLDRLHENEISTGDLFYGKTAENGQDFYWLNIRAQCDLVRTSSIDKTELYCLKGRIIDENKITGKKGSPPFIEGQFIEKVNHSIVSFIDNGKMVEFLFHDLIILKWKAIKTKRIGRLLPPYITSIQQRYALYLQRQGLPRIPALAVLGKK